MPMGPRNIYISILVFVLILFPGTLLFRHGGETARGAVAALAFVACFTVVNVLDFRQRRREGRE
jgi:hypothetical protein